MGTGSDEQAARPGTLALEVLGVSKSFAGSLALSALDLDVPAGCVLALVGENGSGKSTFIKVLSGFHVPDPGGRVLVGGQPLTFGSSDSSHTLGCRFVHQDLGLIPDLSVLDNMSLDGGFASRFGTIRWRESRRRSAAALKRFSGNVDLDEKVEHLTPAVQAGIAIARALRTEPGESVRLLVLDEPTAAMPKNEVSRLHEIVRAVADEGVGVIYVTHFLEEVLSLGNRLAVLRDGHLVGSGDIREFDHESIVNLMVGSHVELVQTHGGDRERPALAENEVAALTVSGLRAKTLNNVSFSVAKGEVVGVAGITGSGREELLHVLFGASPRVSGEVEVRGKSVPAGRTDRSLAAGLAFLPPDRKTQSGVMEMSAAENLTLPSLGRFRTRLGAISKRAEQRQAQTWFARMDVRPADATSRPLGTFSGGNQQKILLAKWLFREPAVLLLDGPTEGVDIAARAGLHQQLLHSADSGVAVLVASNDIEELVSICSRVLVLVRGEIAASIVVDGELGVPTIMRHMLDDRGDAGPRDSEELFSV